MLGFVKIQPFKGSKETIKEGKDGLDYFFFFKKINIIFYLINEILLIVQILFGSTTFKKIWKISNFMLCILLWSVGSKYDPTMICENGGALSIIKVCALSYHVTKYKKEITYKVGNSYCMGNFSGGNSVLA